METIKLSSGAELKVSPAPFAVSRALYQSFLSEVKGLKMDPKAEVDVNLWKDLFCAVMSSKIVEEKLEECMKRCLYNGLKIDSETFEPIQARGDYMTVCLEVGKANILPFMKDLSVQSESLMAKLGVTRP